jgi:hypothetical protein
MNSCPTLDMDRFTWMIHGPHRLLKADYSGADPEQFIELAEHERQVIAQEPPGSVLLLTDLTGIRFSPAAAEALKRTAERHSDRIRASAVIGASPIVRLALRNTARATGRELFMAETREEGLAYLAERAAA